MTRYEQARIGGGADAREIQRATLDQRRLQDEETNRLKEERMRTTVSRTEYNQEYVPAAKARGETPLGFSDWKMKMSRAAAATGETKYAALMGEDRATRRIAIRDKIRPCARLYCLRKPIKVRIQVAVQLAVRNPAGFLASKQGLHSLGNLLAILIMRGKLMTKGDDRASGRGKPFGQLEQPARQNRAERQEEKRNEP